MAEPGAHVKRSGGCYIMAENSRVCPIDLVVELRAHNGQPTPMRSLSDRQRHWSSTGQRTSGCVGDVCMPIVAPQRKGFFDHSSG
jgi:hypothetical protein